MSQTCSYTGSSIKSMPCPKHGLTLTIEIGADAMSQTWSYTSSHISVSMPCPGRDLTLTPLYVPMPCPRHGLTLTHLVADPCPRHVLHRLTSRDRCMSQTCLTLALVSMPMPCPGHGLTLALIIRISWHEYLIYFLRFKREFYYLNIHHT
ncbi:MIT domain-containing 1 [Gossypium arboreum]|uniref:MIT domain-containing 1 n=1 Tax=Gossypium arboreum TaxID=29729 RepID=A0A0B0N1S4_GOSAR|nr:MIT domain-containing 1 [Gossypium arboreum]